MMRVRMICLVDRERLGIVIDRMIYRTTERPLDAGRCPATASEIIYDDFTHAQSTVVSVPPMQPGARI